MSKSGDFLEFSDILLEAKGSMAKGRCKFTDTHIVFKNSKTGKVEQLASSEIDGVSWQRFAGHWGIRVFLRSGALHRFGGFKETDKEKLAKFFSQRYSNTMLERELSLKGWNWGTAKFTGSVLTFDVGRDSDFDVPLSYVSQCTTGKNEVTLEFHQNDEAAVSLTEMRFHIPSSELAGGDDPVEAFREQVMGKASIISATGDAIAIFREVQCLTPRGRYDIKMFPSFFQLHGKTFDYKVTMSSILRIFLLPHKDGRQTFFVISLDPPIKQGQTRYHYLVCLFSHDEEDTTIELPFSEEELKTKYDGKLSKELSGPTFDIIGRIFKALVNRKITVPGGFKGHSGTAAIGCSYKAAAGYMYPLERGFIYVHKPPLHIRFEEIASVNFARSGGSTRSFDFEVEMKSNIIHTFSSIEKEEYPRLFDFITEKKLRVKNRGKMDKPHFTGDFEDSDAEAEPDAYLARVKAEAEERSDDDDESSEDEDYNPDQDKNKPKDDDSSAISSSGEGSDYDPDQIGSDMETGDKKTKKPKRESKPKKKAKTERADGEPKRPTTAFMLWMNASRESMKKKYPDLSLTEMSKKAGEIWRTLSSSDKKEWEDKQKKAKEKYDVEKEEWRKTHGDTKRSSPKKASKSSSKPSKSSSSSPKKKGSDNGGSGAGFKSKEFISDSDSDSGPGSDSDSGKKKSKSKGKAKPAKKEVKKGKGKEPKKEKKSESEDEGSAEATPSDSD